MGSFIMRLIGKGVREIQKNVLVKGSTEEVTSVVKKCHTRLNALCGRLKPEMDSYKGRELSFFGSDAATKYVIKTYLPKPEYCVAKININLKPMPLVDAESYYNKRVMKELKKEAKYY